LETFLSQRSEIRATETRATEVGASEVRDQRSDSRGQRTARASNQSTVISESTGFASDYAMPRRSEIRCQITDDRESIMPKSKCQINAKSPMSNEEWQE
jgi:hypothetical protein